MRDPIHSDQEIITAGIALKAAGVEVNGWSLRKHLGDVGRPNRLASVWKKWVDTEAHVNVPALPAELKSGLTSILTAMGQQVEVLLAALYQEASDAAAHRTQEIESRLSDATERFEREAAVASAELERLEAIIQERDEQLAKSNERLSQLDQQLASTSSDLNLANERLQVTTGNLQRAVAETAVVSTRCHDLEQMVRDVERRLAGETQRAVALEALTKRLDSDLSKARSEVSESNGREAMLAGQLGTLREQIAAEALVTANLRAELHSSTESLTEKNVLLRVSQENEIQLRTDLDAANEVIDSYKAQLLELGRGKV